MAKTNVPSRGNVFFDALSLVRAQAYVKVLKGH